MKTFLKIIKTLIIITIILLISYFGYQEYLQAKYPLHKIAVLLNQVEIPDNIHIKINSVDDISDYTREIYFKDNIIHKYQKSISLLENGPSYEYFHIISDNTSVEFCYDPKTIIEYDKIDLDFTAEEEMMLIYTSGADDVFSQVSNAANQGINKNPYRYLGKVTIDDKECLKFSIDNITSMFKKTIYYMDIETNLIIKTEGYTSNNLETPLLITTYEYNFNSVTDLKEFDKNDYPDFTYTKHKR